MTEPAPNTRPYRIVAVSLYHDEANAADKLTSILRRGGWPKANRSLVMREALIMLEEELAGKTAEDVSIISPRVMLAARPRL